MATLAGSHVNTVTLIALEMMLTGSGATIDNLVYFSLFCSLPRLLHRRLVIVGRRFGSAEVETKEGK